MSKSSKAAKEPEGEAEAADALPEAPAEAAPEATAALAPEPAEPQPPTSPYPERVYSAIPHEQPFEHLGVGYVLRPGVNFLPADAAAFVAGAAGQVGSAGGYFGQRGVRWLGFGAEQDAATKAAADADYVRFHTPEEK